MLQSLLLQFLKYTKFNYFLTKTTKSFNWVLNLLVFKINRLRNTSYRNKNIKYIIILILIIFVSSPKAVKTYMLATK